MTINLMNNNESENCVQSFASIIQNLYQVILATEISPKEPAYTAFLDNGKPFYLDYQGYRKAYFELIQKTFQQSNVGEMWSEDGILDLGHILLRDLANTKNKDGKSPDFNVLATDWLKNFNLQFEESDCYLVVCGLRIDEPLEIGNVTFLPSTTQIPDLANEIGSTFQKNVNSYRDCFSCSKVTAEWRKASQIHYEKTEKALNVIRFFGSLIWHDQPTRHIYIASQNPKKIRDSLVITKGRGVSSLSSSDITPLPMYFDSEVMPIAKFYGLQKIQSLLKQTDSNEIEKSFLTAIQWFGHATQELFPLIAFVKYYISIEVALKRPGENAKDVLPRRLGVLLNPWDPDKEKEFEDIFRHFIDERNSVFHSGFPLSENPRQLHVDSEILARQALHQIRLKLESEKWQTKEDLITWVASQYKKISNCHNK